MYSSIQAAVNAAKPGATIYVAAGTYHEDVYINKYLTLIGTSNPKASSFTLNTILGAGSGGITAPIVNVNPAAKIQDGVTFASSGGTVNVAAGTYLEDVNINKGLTLKGLGNPTANSFSLTNGAILGAESGGITGSLVTVNSHSTITDGILLSSKEVHVYGDEGNYTYNDELDTRFYGNGIVLAGYDNPVTKSISIDQDVTGKISGITANSVNVKPNAKILQGIDLANIGATVNVKGISGYIYSDDLTQNFYAKAITLTGIDNPITRSISLDRLVAGKIGGIMANAVNVLNPNAKIQDGLTFASSGGTVNVAAGTYLEEVNINNDQTLTGTGNPNASSFTLNAKLGTGSGGITAPIVYVNPTARIQDGVTLASSGGTVKVAAGTYFEDANINKDLTLKGQDNPTTNSFALINSAILGAGSGGITAPIITVNAGSKIQDGITLASTNGKVNVNAGTFTDNLDQSFYTRGVTLMGFNNPVTSSLALNQDVDGKICDITANTVNVNPTARIQDGVTLSSSGGTVNVAAGTYFEDVNINKDLTLKGQGNATANSFSLINGAILGAASGGIDAPQTTVNAGSKIQDGITLASTNGKVNVNAGAFGDNLDQSFYARGVTLTGFNNPVTNSFTLNQDIDGKISGITANIVYVDPNAKIQDSFTLTSSGGTVKVTAGTYFEDVNINKDLTLKGHGNPTANSFALINSAILGAGSGGITAPLITVNAGSKIQDGITLASTNGKVNVNAGAFGDNLDQSFYIKGVTLTGVGNPVTNSFTLDRDVDGKISGITANTVNVNPNAKIQDGVNLSLSGGTVNAVAGTYKENLIIDKSLTVNGAGTGSTIIVDGNKTGSVFTLGRNDPNIEISLSGMTITEGTGTTTIGGIFGGGVVNYGRLLVSDCIITGNSAEYGGGVYNYGTMTLNSGSINGNEGGGFFNNGGIVNLDGGSITANTGGGLFNSGGTVNLDGSSITANTGGGIYNRGTLNMNSGNITENTAQAGGGIFNYPEGTVDLNGGSISENTATEYGGGIYSTNSMITFDGTRVIVTSNKAHLPMPSELSWYQGWGLYIPTVTPPTTTNGFDPSTQVTGSAQI
jgi:predicted outer membrane repeat protein